MPPGAQPVSRALLLFGVAIASSWAFTYVRGPLGLTDVRFGRLQFGLFWLASVLSTWWGTAVAPAAIRYGARGAVFLALAAGLVPSTQLGSGLTLVAQDAPTLLWASLFSAALALALRPASVFFSRGWWVLVGYRIVLHAALWADALSNWSFAAHYPVLAAVGQAMMLVLVAFSWLMLRFPESASEPI
jgi:multidrug transporter EmrE-like cation transporter